MEYEGSNYAYGQCECGKDVKLYGGITYEMESVLDNRTVHECDPEYVTDYWNVTNRAGKRLVVVSGKTAEEAKGNANRDTIARESAKREGGFGLRRMKSHEYRAYYVNEMSR